MSGDLLHVPRFELAGAHASLSGTGEYDIGTGRFREELGATRVDTVLARPWLKDLPIAGHASLRLRAEGGGGKGASWTARLVPEPDLAFAGRSLAALTLEATGEGSLARFEGTLGAQAAFSGAIGTEAPHRGEGKIELRDVSIPQLMALARPDLALQIFGELGGTILWSGPLDDPGALRAEAALSKLRIVLGGESFEARARRSSRSRKGRSVSSGRSSARTVRASGSAAPTRSTKRAASTSGSKGRSISGTWRPSSRSFAPQARSACRCARPGAARSPSCPGVSRSRTARLRVLGFPLASERISLTARVEKNQLVSESIRGWLGGGEFTGKGNVELEGFEPRGFRLEGVLRNSALAFPEGFMGEYSGRVHLGAEEGREAGDLRGPDARPGSLAAGFQSRPALFRQARPGPRGPGRAARDGRQAHDARPHAPRRRQPLVPERPRGRRGERQDPHRRDDREPPAERQVRGVSGRPDAVQQRPLPDRAGDRDLPRGTDAQRGIRRHRGDAGPGLRDPDAPHGNVRPRGLPADLEPPPERQADPLAPAHRRRAERPGRRGRRDAPRAGIHILHGGRRARLDRRQQPAARAQGRGAEDRAPAAREHDLHDRPMPPG